MQLRSVISSQQLAIMALNCSRGDHAATIYIHIHTHTVYISLMGVLKRAFQHSKFEND